MEKKSFKAFAPATVANVGLGFDFMGFALDKAGDTVSVSEGKDHTGITISTGGKYGPLVPSDPLKNTAGVAAKALLLAHGYEGKSLQLRLEKNLPLGSGLGSSAASAAAALVAVNVFLGNPYSAEEMIPFAMEGERVACGTAHADNVAPSLLGGFVIIRSYSPLDIIRLRCPDDLYCAVVHPHIELKTSDSRRILKRDIPLGDVTRQCANVAGFLTGLFREDYDLIARSMHDLLAEPKRLQLIPGYEKVKNAAMSAGATGCGISGSGPSVFALCKGETAARDVAYAMKHALESTGLGADEFISTLSSPGAHIV